MNKEEILERSRKENKNKDIIELDAIRGGCRVAYLVGPIACIVLCFMQMAIKHTINWGCWAINFSILDTVFLVKYVKLRKKHELIMTIFYFVLCIFFLIGFIMALRG